VSGTTAIGQSAGATRTRRPFGVRLYLTIGFAAVALITAGFSYILITGSSENAASERAADITVGRTVRLADRIGAHPVSASATEVESITDPGYSAWVFGERGRLLTPRVSRGVALGSVPGRRTAINVALRGSRAVNALPDSVTLASAPVFRNGRLTGALLARADRPQEIAQAVEALRGDRLTAAAVAIAVAIVIGFLIATAITSRVKRLADGAARMTEGRLDEPLVAAGGRDEITELGTALETMRVALRETNRFVRAEARIRLRLGLQFGLVLAAADGFAGSAVVEACRLRDCGPVRALLRADPGTDLVVAASPRVYDEGLRAAGFARTGSGPATAWVSATA